MPLKALTVLSCVLSIAVMAMPVGALAHGGAKGVVKERMDAMEMMGKAMKYVSGMLRGDVRLDMAPLDEAAKSLALHGQRIPDLFPKGSHQVGSDASPKIWMDFPSFKQRADKMVAAARALSSAAQAGDVDRVKSAHKALGKACGGCHSLFRVAKSRQDKQETLWSRMADRFSDFIGD